ncbi:hypothetical protein AB0C93_02410 [Streptomyces sp. NPDC048518]|uniref:hypothetical protein n=1 Tax=Streptomyces sp. NPDC048518 TaxID=3155029 RepID=UPI0033C940A1
MRRVELPGRADAVLMMLPDDVHEEVLAVIDAVSDAPETDQGNSTEVFGTASWVLCGTAGNVVEVLDVGGQADAAAILTPVTNDVVRRCRLL